jgi:hypothetical protein
LATIIGIKGSLDFIPDKFINQIRKIYIRHLENVVNQPENTICWKKFFLLPTVLFTSADKEVLKHNMVLIEANNWATFTLGGFAKRGYSSNPLLASNHGYNTRSRSTTVNHDQQAAISQAAHSAFVDEVADRGTEFSSKDKRTKKLIAHSNLSAAMRNHTNMQGLSNVTPDTLDKLKAKHPLRNNNLTDEEMAVLTSSEVNDNILICASFNQIRQIIKRSKNLTRHGIDKLRYEHLKALVGYGAVANPDEEQFTDLLTRLVNLIISKKTPAEVLPFLADNEIIAIPKAVDDIRPIGMGGVLRKLASTVIFQETSIDFNKSYFGDLQLAFYPAGIEEVVHSFNINMQVHPDWDVFAMDADNAFNSANRLQTLLTIKEHFPSALPLLLDMYLEESNGWLFGLTDGIAPIKSSEGFHQGDVLATWAYSMGIQPLIKRISETIRNEFIERFGERIVLQILIKFYVDDGNISAPHEIMVRIIELFYEWGPQFGYKIKNNKGKYLLGKTGSALADRRKEFLVDQFGISPSIIIAHPDDITSNDVVQDAIYGANILGSFVGTDTYIKNQLQIYASEIEGVAQTLSSYPDIQGRMLLFSRCFCLKPLHIFRTIPSSLCNSFVHELEQIKHRFLIDVLQMPISVQAFEWMRFNIGQGGLGIQDYHNTSRAAYAASFLQFALGVHNSKYDLRNYFTRLHEQRIGTQLLAVDNFIVNIREIGYDIVNNGAAIQDLYLLVDEKKKTETLQSIFNKNLEITRMKNFLSHLQPQVVGWITSLQNSESGKWLEVVPKKIKFTFSNADFTTLLKYRFQLNISAHLAGSHCNCVPAGRIDALGHHFATGCINNGYRIATHDAVVHEVNSLLYYAGFRTKREEQNCFSAEMNPALPPSLPPPPGLPPPLLIPPDPPNRRPDISILNPLPNFTVAHKICIDVAITSPLAGAQNGVLLPLLPDQALIKGRMASLRAKDKVNSYKNLLTLDGPMVPLSTDFKQQPTPGTTYGFHFVPFVMESTGHFHVAAKQFINLLSQEAANIHKIPAVTIKRYFQKCISCTLQKGIANAINKRLLNANTNGMITHTLANFPRSVEEI